MAGCAFVTYDNKESAERAQKELHDNMTLPGVSLTTIRCLCCAYSTYSSSSSFYPFVHALIQMSRPLQVKPAGTDGRAGNVRCVVMVNMLDLFPPVLVFSLSLALSVSLSPPSLSPPRRITQGVCRHAK